ncbi:MAG: zf-HC2 domain-containing protein [Gammaproteobacteria bacterium]
MRGAELGRGKELSLDSCRDISALVSRAMDTRLTVGERVRVRLHLAICSACRRFARQVRQLRAATRELARRAIQ